MRAAAISLSLGAALLAMAGETQALGFGRVVNVSTLGQPLNFAATVRLENDEQLPRECVSAEVLSGDRTLPQEALRVTVEPGADANERQVRITTMTPIDEPVATVNVTAGCIPRLSRSFVMLIDPPLVNLAQSAATPAPALPPQRVESQAAPAVAVAQAAAAETRPQAAPRPPAREPSARPRPARPAIAPAPQAATIEADAPRPRRAAQAPARVATRPPASGPRLRLEQAAPVVTAAASAPRPPEEIAAEAAAAASAAQAAAAASSAVEAERARIAALEQNLAALRDSTEKNQRALAELQARLQESEAARYANPLVYALAVLAAFLSVVVAVLWWRQSHPRGGGSQWWLAPAAGVATGSGALRGAQGRRTSIDPSTGSAKLETEPAVMDDRANRSIVDDMPPRLSPAAIVTPPPPPIAPPRPVAPPTEPPAQRRELSVEELIDLEQQADFFVVLGQDEAAIDLLMGHVRSSGGVSPLPYLKLLEIYRRRGERESYERVRERFNRRFNAYAPEWDADLQHGKSLEDYPKIQQQLQRYWDEPSRITALLDDSLMRQAEGGESFDLPAYRELLFLYSIARDLAEHPAAVTGVDLLLPLEFEDREAPIEHLSASRLMGFAPTLAPDPPHVDLDVTRPAPVDGSPPSDFMGLVGDPRKERKG